MKTAKTQTSRIDSAVYQGKLVFTETMDVGGVNAEGQTEAESASKAGVIAGMQARSKDGMKTGSTAETEACAKA